MSRRLLTGCILLAVVAASGPAHAADPQSKVQRFKVSLGAFVKFDDTASLAESTVDFLVDPKLPAWTKQGSKIIVPSCSQALVGSLQIEAAMTPDHTTSVVHWAIGSLGGAEWPIAGQGNSNCFGDSPPPPQGGCHKYVSKSWTINIPIVPGQSLHHITAWTSKQGQKSQVKSALLRVNCEEAPKAPTTIKPGVVVPTTPPAPTGTTLKPGSPLPVLPQLDLRSIRLDFGFADANAVEWGKGQPVQNEVLFHQAIGAPFERGGSQWGAEQAVTVGGQTYASHAIDSCSSIMKLRKYIVRSKNGGTVGYAGTSTNDLRAATNGPGGSFISTGAVGSVGANLETSSMLDVSNQGVTFYPSGTYTVKTELLPPAASANPANNAAQLTFVFKCKALNATTWQ